MKKIHVLLFLVAAVFAFQPAGAMEPIRLVFDIHIEPMPQIPLPQRYENYLVQRAEVLWLSDTCAALTGCKLSMEANGEFMEFLADDGDTVVVPHYLNNGHQWGTHVHPYFQVGPHNWIYAGQNCSPDTSAIVWEDNIAMVEQFITHEQNNAMSSQVPGLAPIQYQFMVDYGFEITGGGPTEVCMNYFQHLPWNPSRPSPQMFIMEDPYQRDFFQIPHFPQIGSVGLHGPQQSFFDLTLESLQAEFLKLYVEWLRHDRLGDDERVWSLGWNTHANLNGQYRGVVLAFLNWLNDNFVGHTSPYGSLIAEYASFNEVRDAFYAWEEAHPGESSFTYTPGDPYPYSYPFLVDMLAYNHYVADIPLWQSSGIHAHALLDSSGAPRWLLWKDFGEGWIDFTAVYGQELVAFDPVTGQPLVAFPDSVPVGEEPLLLAPAPQAPLPPLAFEESRFGLFATHAPEFGYFEQQMGFNHSQYWEWADGHVQNLDAHWTRSNLQLVWDICQPTIGGAYNWNNEMWTDSVIINIYEPGNELNWLGVFHEGGPDLRNPLEYPLEYHQFVMDAVERFDGDSVAAVNPYVQVKWWQIGNEVMGWISQNHSAQDYVRWLRICEDAIHGADPEARIVLIAPTQATLADTFLFEVIRSAAGMDLFDAIDVHSWGPANTWEMEAVPVYRRLLDRFGYDQAQIWSCENGTWAYGPAGSPYQPPVVQARFLAKRFAANLAQGLDKLFWNNLMEWNNFGGDPNCLFNSMGLIGDGAGCGEPPSMFNVLRPAYATYQILADFLDQPTEMIGLDSSNTIPNQLYSYLYHKPAEAYPFRIMWREMGGGPYPLNLGVSRALVTPLIPDSSGQLPPSYFVMADSAGIIPLFLGLNPLAVEASPVGQEASGMTSSTSAPESAGLPAAFALTGAYPNPFNPTTTIRFELPVAGMVKLEVFDLHGRHTGTRHTLSLPNVGFGESDLQLQPGTHEITFDGSGLPSGIYFLRLTAGNYMAVQKMVLMK